MDPRARVKERNGPTRETAAVPNLAISVFLKAFSRTAAPTTSAETRQPQLLCRERSSSSTYIVRNTIIRTMSLS